MVSDLDRFYKPEMPHSVSVAYGLQGRSLTTNTMRKMLKYVMSECSEKGLYIVHTGFSSDGQWYNLYVKDNNDEPLTVLQLQKVTWNNIKKLKKNELVDKLSGVNVIHSDSPTFQEHIDIVVENNNRISVRDLKGQKVAIFTQYHAGFLKGDHKLIEDHDTNKEDSATRYSNALDEILGLLPANIEEKMGSEFTEQLRNMLHICSDQLDKRSENNKGLIDEIDDQRKKIDSQSIASNERPNSTNSPLEQQPTTLISDEHIKAMLVEWQTSLPEKWRKISEKDFRDRLISAEKINKHFLKKELTVCLKVVHPILKRNYIKCNLSWSKEQIVNMISEHIGDGSKVKHSSKKCRNGNLSPLKFYVKELWVNTQTSIKRLI